VADGVSVTVTCQDKKSKQFAREANKEDIAEKNKRGVTKSITQLWRYLGYEPDQNLMLPHCHFH
jgi:hypothetical protein